jgi:hypothetical protein
LLIYVSIFPAAVFEFRNKPAKVNQNPGTDGRSNWLELPDEVLQDIFQYLPAGNIVCDLPVVCKRFFVVLKSGINIQDLVINTDSPAYIRSLVATVSLCVRMQIVPCFFQLADISNKLLLSLASNFYGSLREFNTLPFFSYDAMTKGLNLLQNVVVPVVKESKKLRKCELYVSVSDEGHLSLLNESASSISIAKIRT